MNQSKRNDPRFKVRRINAGAYGRNVGIYVDSLGRYRGTSAGANLLGYARIARHPDKPHSIENTLWIDLLEPRRYLFVRV